METKLLFLDEADPEFKYAFSKFPDPVMYNEAWGEVLQYMGTVIKEGEVPVHEFRHRAVPGTNERQYWKIKASYDFWAKIRYGIEVKGVYV